MRAHHAEPVGGPVRPVNDADLSWLDGPADVKLPTWWSRPRWDEARDWLAGNQPSLLENAEQSCIRIAAHIGETAPPVNSKHASAWATDAESDWIGWVVAQRLSNDQFPGSIVKSRRRVMGGG